MKRIRLFFILLLLPLLISAQNKLRQADQAFASEQYFQALQLYKAAYADKSKSKSDVPRNFYQQAECYRMICDWNMAKVYYDKAIRAKYPNDRAHLYLAQSHQMSGEYSEAIAEFEKYKQLVPSDPAADIGIRACTVSLSWLGEPTRWRVSNEAQLNSKANDFCPTFSNRKHNALIFSSKRQGQTGSKIDPISGGLYSDLFEAMIDKNGKWSTPASVQGDVNMPTANDGASCITKNGNHIFFTKCGQKKKKFVTCKIYYAEKQGNKWGTPTLVDFGLDAATLDSFNFRHPAVSVNEDVMVFSSDMSGTTGGEHSDLWVSTFDKKTHKWSKPVNMGREINTAAREGFPYIAEDGSLYFSSDGHAGMGGLDIYRAPKTSATKWEWGTPENMKAPINSPADDFGIVFDGKQQKGYLTSNRQGTKGLDDIWRFYYEIFYPPIEIKVFDCENKVGIKNALVEIIGNDGSTIRMFSDINGECHFKLKENVNYTLNVFGDSASSLKAQAYFSLPENEKGKVTTAGTLQLKLDWCDTNELIYSVIQKLQITKGVHKIEFEADEALPLFKMDSGLLEQILHNILHNALLYTPDSSTITIKASLQNDNCVISIADNGKGFPESEIQFIFDKFYRLPKSKTGGTGLGLSIAKGFTEAHHGTLTLENLKTGGAKFTINIPAETSYIKNLKNE